MKVCEFIVYSIHEAVRSTFEYACIHEMFSVVIGDYYILIQYKHHIFWICILILIVRRMRFISLYIKVFLFFEQLYQISCTLLILFIRRSLWSVTIKPIFHKSNHCLQPFDAYEIPLQQRIVHKGLLPQIPKVQTSPLEVRMG